MSDSPPEDAIEEPAGSEPDGSPVELATVQEGEHPIDSPTTGSRGGGGRISPGWPVAVTLCMMAGLTAIFLPYTRDPGSSKLATPQVYRYAISDSAAQPVRPLPFDAFIIPFSKGKTHSYVSISMTFNLPSDALRREMLGNTPAIRGVIYDTLLKETNRPGGGLSLDALKALITRSVNGVLAGGVIKGVYIDRYLAV